MKRQWTDNQAIECLSRYGAKLQGNTITLKEHKLGLTGCGAYDYIKNHSKSLVILNH